MIVPTARAALLALLGLPVALLLAAVRPDAWALGLAWPVGVAALVLADALLARWPMRVVTEVSAPGGLEVGRAARVVVAARGAPAGTEAILETEGPLHADAPTRDADAFIFAVHPERRGEGRIVRAWLRWPGPLKLVSAQKRVRIDKSVSITPDVTTVREEALKLASRHQLGESVQRRRGEGTEFEALREFQTGMDRRAIDWKHTARHRTLLAREYRTERNQNIVMAIDAGRLMSEPVVPGGLSRLDHAVTAALLSSYVALRQGDRAALFAYDARPQVSTGLVHGARAYPALQRAATSIAYSPLETNHTLGLHTLAGKLDRRSLVVVLTEFADTTTAELMIQTIGHLTRDHLVLFIAFRDEALETMRDAEPSSPEDVSRAVVADDLLAERELVLARLRRMGADVLEAHADTLGPAVLGRTIAVRERGLL